MVQEQTQAHRLLSAFRIVCSPEAPKGVLLPLASDLSRIGGVDRLQNHRDGLRRYFEENHLEEWVARCPRSIFPYEDVHIIASQNYAHLPKKVDILYVSDSGEFFVAEVKTERVAQNAGVVPYSIYSQMKGYVDFLLTDQLVGYPHSFAKHYSKFSERFFGVSQPLPEVSRETQQEEIRLTEVYLTEGYDSYALGYLSERSAIDRRTVRLLYYSFYPSDRHIEFWEIQI